MIRASFALACLLVVPAPHALACDHDRDHPSRWTTWDDGPVHWVERHDPDAARLAITNEDGGATLVLTDEVVALQLSERTLRKIDRKLREEHEADDDHALGRAIRTAVISGVRALLDHSAECSIRDLSEARYRNGCLILVTKDGERIFDEVEIDDEEVMSAFSERDARAFVREFQHLKSSRR